MRSVNCIFKPEEACKERAGFAAKFKRTERFQVYFSEVLAPWKTGYFSGTLALFASLPLTRMNYNI